MVSVIVPVLNEARIIGESLRALLHQASDCEVVLVDGGSTDDTMAAAGAIAAVHCISSGKGRGRQLNAGVACAHGDILLFLHADTRLPEGAIRAVERAVTRGITAGAFTHSFAQRDWRLRAISAGHNLKCRFNRIYYGDHAIFATRAVFDRVCGFPDVPVLEDVIFCQRLKRARVRSALLPEVVVTDGRRFLQHGVWRTTARALWLLGRHALGLRPGDERSWDVAR